jgi:hypothetical protein
MIVNHQFSKLFSSHSFRRGGATLAAQTGISSSLIQLMGDWKSDAYNKYIVEIMLFSQFLHK